MGEKVTKNLFAIPGAGTPTATTDPNDPNADIQLGGAITSKMKTVYETSILEAADTFVTNRPYSIPPPEPENKTKFGWFAYYDDCIKCGEPKTHETIWMMYNEQCDPSKAIPTVEAWRQAYIRWKLKYKHK